MQLSIHDQTLKRVGFINNNLPDALHYYDDNWHRYLAEGTSTFDFSVNKVNPDYALLTLQSYVSFTYDGEDYLFNIINIEQDHYSMHLQCENLNLALISEEVGAYVNTKRHSIVWYLKNAAKITDDLVEIGNNPFPLVDDDVSNPILSFDNDETKLSRIISICKSFNAEFQFKTQLKNDGTLQNITIDLYKEGDVGQKRKDVTLYYGKNIAGITSKADRTSTFFNATTVTDSKNKFNWLSVEGKHYNSDGQLEFYKDAGNNTAYAPLSRDMFPSQLKSASSDRYTRKNLSIEATSANSLWDYAVIQFKQYAYPQMTYEVSVAVNAVTNALGNNRRLDIGDTITVQDNTFDKSEGGLILSARVSEQEISFTNLQSNKIIFTNFVKLKSEISADLYGRMKDLVDQNTPYRFEIVSDNGLTFKNSTRSTTLTARVYKGSNIDEVSVDSFEWLIDGVSFGGITKSQLVSASQVTGTAVVRYNAKLGDTVIGGVEVTLQYVSDGANGISPTVTVNPDTSLTIIDAQGTRTTPVLKGSDGTSGVIVSSVAPASPKTGQLWQDTSTTPQLVKKWTGTSWVIWELYAQNLKADSLSALSANLGDVSAGTVKLMDDVDVNRTLKKYGLYQSKLGLLSSGPALANLVAPGTLSNTQMGVANLNKGELRFMVTDYTENLKDVQEAGMSDQNHAFIKFDSYDNGKDIMTIGSSGDIVFKGNTSQDTQWVKMTAFAYYKVMFGRVNIRVGLTSGSSRGNIYLGAVPNKYKSPNGDMMLPAQAWSINTGLDRHVQYTTDGNLYLLNPEPNTKYVFEASYTL